jgi:hypothetical protein
MTTQALKEVTAKKQELEAVLTQPHCEEIDHIFERFAEVGFNKDDTLTFTAQLNYLKSKNIYIKVD